MGLLDPPSISQAALATTVNGGIKLRYITDAARLAMTPAIDELILTSDTQYYFTGDGSTVGGVNSPLTGISQDQARRLGIINPRIHDFSASVRTATTAFMSTAVGNSIVQGTGASTASLNWVYLLSNLLQIETLIDTTNDWMVANTGVGGSQITVPLGYSADLLTSAGIFTAGINRRGRRKLAVVMTMRNDVATGASLWNQRARTLIRGLLQGYEDVVVVAEPPQMTYATGAILDGQQWKSITNIMKEVCADYGVTYVDVWKKWMLERAAGADLKQRMSDGTHPNDVGHRMIADMVFQAMMTPASQSFTRTRDRSSDGTAAMALPVAAYTPVTASVGTSAVSGLTSATTARKRELAEGTAVAYSLANTQTMRFDIPLPMYRLRPVMVQGGLSTGSITIDGVALSAIASSAGAALELPNNPTTMPSPVTPGIVVITCTHASNPLKVLGIQVDVPEAMDQHEVWAGGTESGVWIPATFAATGVASGAAVRSAAIVGAYIDITWYGTHLTFAIETGTDRGKLSEVTDGGATTTYDAYATTASYLYRCTPELTVGWHTTRLTVATKNASSSANTVAVGFYKTTIPPDASLGYITLSQGETMQLHGRWKMATVERVISGAPYVSGWSPGATSIALGGTGNAIVRLQR